MVPALAVALLVVGGSLALTFDRLWQDTAIIELETAGDAAVLAAARELASDDTLKAEPDWASICQEARTTAADFARQNSVGGLEVVLNDAEEGDVRFGAMIENAVGEMVFAQTKDRPRTAVVRAHQGRGSRNPVGLLVRDLNGAGRLLEVFTAATADNRITGVRPFEGVNVPALPIAIFAGSAATPGWNSLIELHLGPDTSGPVEGTKTIAPTPDGLSEMTPFSAPQQADEKQQLAATLHLVDIGAGLDDRTLAEQCRHGWSMEDLEDSNGELRCDGGPHLFTSRPKIPASVASELSQLVGEVRLCWAFDVAAPTADPSRCQVTCSRLIGIRILGVVELPDGMVTLHVQPTAIVTRTALVSEDGDESLTNPYLYKVFLVH